MCVNFFLRVFGQKNTLRDENSTKKLICRQKIALCNKNITACTKKYIQTLRAFRRAGLLGIGEP